VEKQTNEFNSSKLLLRLSKNLKNDGWFDDEKSFSWQDFKELINFYQTLSIFLVTYIKSKCYIGRQDC
jgi:hypothetical protein